MWFDWKLRIDVQWKSSLCEARVSGDGLTTRLATAEDAPALVALVTSAFSGESSKAGWTTEADLLDGQRTDLEAVTEMISAPGHVILVHVQDHDMVACAHLKETDADCYLGMLTVQPTAQSSGLGRRMLEDNERWAIDHWASRSIQMTVVVQRVELIAW